MNELPGRLVLDDLSRRITNTVVRAMVLVILALVAVSVAAADPWTGVLPGPLWWATAGVLAVCLVQNLVGAARVADERAHLRCCPSCLVEAGREMTAQQARTACAGKACTEKQHE